MWNFKYTCIVDTTYTLSLYLLMMSVEDIKHTLFFVGNSIPDFVCERLKNVVQMPSNKKVFSSKFSLFFRIKCLLKYYPIIRFTKIYAQDHLPFCPQLINHMKYTLLEDSPGVFSFYKEMGSFQREDIKTLRDKIHCYIHMGPNFGCKLGQSNKCINRILTEPKDLKSDIIEDYNHKIVNLDELWKNSSREKKNFLLSLWNINSSLLTKFQTYDTIIFTQPFIEDCGITFNEMQKIYEPYINKYTSTGLLIKPHPRDKFPYEKIYPNVHILNSLAPMQLLSAVGLKFKRAITVCSTAISSMPSDCEIIWLGTSVNEKIRIFCGNPQCPR